MDSRVQAGLEKSNRSLSLTLEKYYTLLYDFCTDDDMIDLVEKFNAGAEDMESVKIRIRRELKHICNRNDGVIGLAVLQRTEPAFTMTPVLLHQQQASDNSSMNCCRMRWRCISP